MRASAARSAMLSPGNASAAASDSERRAATKGEKKRLRIFVRLLKKAHENCRQPCKAKPIGGFVGRDAHPLAGRNRQAIIRRATIRRAICWCNPERSRKTKM